MPVLAASRMMSVVESPGTDPPLRMGGRDWKRILHAFAIVLEEGKIDPASSSVGSMSRSKPAATNPAAAKNRLARLKNLLPIKRRMTQRAIIIKPRNQRKVNVAALRRTQTEDREPSRLAARSTAAERGSDSTFLMRP